jgi:hypothetical protein
VEVHSRIKSAIEEVWRGREQRRALEEQAKHFQDLGKEEALKKEEFAAEGFKGGC